jgi:hypothetical protein
MFFLAARALACFNPKWPKSNFLVAYFEPLTRREFATGRSP